MWAWKFTTTSSLEPKQHHRVLLLAGPPGQPLLEPWGTQLVVQGLKCAADLVEDGDTVWRVRLGRAGADVYPGSSICMSIKDSEVHAMAREQERTDRESQEQAVLARRQRVRELLHAIYDDHGRPV